MPPNVRHRRLHRILAAAAGLATVGTLLAALPAGAHGSRPGPQHPGRYPRRTSR
ncbi:hypothetical protein ACFYZE_34425 [Streptomyces sp. NPDC001796]|uniref:hypothetical protein n=1 Tax=Streptomyces sp. NPDC001796 TaxID=3364609 RepID=UPI003697DB93